MQRGAVVAVGRRRSMGPESGQLWDETGDQVGSFTAPGRFRTGLVGLLAWFGAASGAVWLWFDAVGRSRFFGNAAPMVVTLAIAAAFALLFVLLYGLGRLALPRPPLQVRSTDGAPLLGIREQPTLSGRGLRYRVTDGAGNALAQLAWRRGRWQVVSEDGHGQPCTMADPELRGAAFRAFLMATRPFRVENGQIRGPDGALLGEIDWLDQPERWSLACTDVGRADRRLLLALALQADLAFHGRA